MISRYEVNNDDDRVSPVSLGSDVPRATREKEEGLFHRKNMVFLEKVWLGPRALVMSTPCSALADLRCAVSQGHQHQDKARCS